MKNTTTISNEKLSATQELLANTAITQLEEGIDFNLLENTNVEFGYIYLTDGEYQSLFKIITDKKTTYFVAQKGRLMRLADNFGDTLFYTTIHQVIEMHGDWK